MYRTFKVRLSFTSLQWIGLIGQFFQVFQKQNTFVGLLQMDKGPLRIRVLNRHFIHRGPFKKQRSSQDKGLLQVWIENLLQVLEDLSLFLQTEYFFAVLLQMDGGLLPLKDLYSTFNKSSVDRGAPIDNIFTGLLQTEYLLQVFYRWIEVLHG